MNLFGKKLLLTGLLAAGTFFAAMGINPVQAAAADPAQGAIDFRQAAEAERTDVINFRRDLHEYPELGEDTKRSAGKITEELTKMGIPYVVDSHNNVIGKITGGQPGKKIAIRADYDALPVEEDTGLPYSSKIQGQMHACGHDIHAAGLVGAAKILNDNKSALKGTVYVCFQVAEETTGGARYIVDYLKQQGGVDTAVGVHTMPLMSAGEYGTRPGAMLSGCVQWKITVHGVGGHGSQPWVIVDPIKPAAEILLRVSKMQGTAFSAFDPYIVSAGLFQAGTKGNIIPETATIEGTLRYYKPEQLDAIPKAMEEIAKNVAASYGASVDVTFNKEQSIVPVSNSQDCVNRAEDVAHELGFKLNNDFPVNTGSDDMADLVNTFGGVYIWSGTLKAGQPVVYQHNPKFDPDEESIIDNAAFLAAYAYDFLNGTTVQQQASDNFKIEGDVSEGDDDVPEV